MSTTLIVNLSGVLLIALIVWWFWLSSKKAITTSSDAPIEIIVEGGVYTPGQIRVPAGQSRRLRFIRKDAGPCAAIVKFDALDKSAELPVSKPFDLDVRFEQPGRYEFTCQMGMYRGVIIAE
jgi:plastocyanin domain-containing protein